MELDVIICCSNLGGKADILIRSLFEISSECDFIVHLIKEKGFRERTLNEGMRFVGSRDLLIFGDDVTLTKGWFQALKKYKAKGDIIGYSMLYPNSSRIQDTGYELIKIDNRITLHPRNRGKQTKQVKRFGYKSCDTVCGCAIFVKKKVLKRLRRFSEDGRNRWGEFIFTQQAEKLGFKVIVLGHYLYHEGKSTKTNKELKYGSISWQREKKLWARIVSKYVDENRIKNIYKSKLSEKLKSLLNGGSRVLVYGIGTVGELIAKNTDLKRTVFCTGLKEETGVSFFGRKVVFYTDVRYENYERVIISPLYIANKIYVEKLKRYLLRKKPVYETVCVKKNNIFYYDIVRCS